MLLAQALLAALLALQQADWPEEASFTTGLGFTF
jgi:hypothetical protein